MIVPISTSSAQWSGIDLIGVTIPSIPSQHFFFFSLQGISTKTNMALVQVRRDDLINLTTVFIIYN